MNGNRAPIVWLRCAVCRAPLGYPFSRFSGPVVHFHRIGHGRHCRLVVFPDPCGDAHTVAPIPSGLSAEQALHAAIVEWRERN